MNDAHTWRALALTLLLARVTLDAGAASIEGRVIHPQRPQATAGLEVLLVGVQQGGELFQRRVHADPQGHFELADLPTPGAYLLSATFQDVLFPGGSVVFKEGDPEDEARSVVFHIYDHSRDPSGLTLRRLRWVIQREAGVYQIMQSFLIHNPRLEVILLEDSDPPALRIGLAPGHGPLDRHAGPLPEGARISGDVIELRGPLYPGEQEIRVLYDLGAAATDLTTEIPLPDSTEVLEVYVRDFGIEVDAGGLHPHPPAREADVIYQRFVGFDLAAGTRVPLHVRALPSEAPAPRWLQLSLAALLCSGLMLFVMRPLGQPPRPHDLQSEETEDNPEKQALVAALHDLEHDFETGKLSAEDRDRLRRELRQETLQALARQRRREVPRGPVQDCSCGQTPRPGDRFCGACGKPV